MIKAFIFDLDGVITDTAKLHYLAWQEIVKKLNISYSEEENDKLRGLPRLDTLKAILKLKKINHSLNEDQLIDLCNQKNDLYKELLKKAINKDSVLPGISELLHKAKQNGIKLAVASSSYNAPVILEKLELIGLFDYIVNPGEIKNGKPAPDIYIKAAQGLNVEIDECIGFEDAISGLEAIKSSNMKAVVITHDSLEDFSKADLIYKKTNELEFHTIINYFK
ncbi:beta-phosphoglucomutase [Mycoplasma bradburyae]|uniref:Beta-phosphoglucomutase n=1 Tax=Mycoplasma bradburyae TaxID=2963128 RepID=A0ABT5GBW2_9MOLU|nr:beta-phosphoglucomutase [Mycoplasma bradburyae]MDC4182227.1 beta-phosphoglucomutase [Mycoplasma bradburyae]UTS70051.1 beta-phosphoglucomutase [Mycoplasma bradburyae]